MTRRARRKGWCGMVSVYDLWLGDRLMRFKKDVRIVCDRFSSAFDVFMENFEDSEKREAISEGCLEALLDKNISSFMNLADKCTRLGISVVTYKSEFYPHFLADIETPPYLLFVKGNVQVLKERFCVSTVGTRKMSDYGKYYAFKIGYEIASAGGVIVSGMAKGIDSVTHAGALAAGGRTVAVLGSGVDIVYPKEHIMLYNSIIKEGGAVISEYFPGATPLPANFPARNRIICGMSYATVVIEAPKQSGALITAGEAIKEGRTVFALPGNLNEESSYGTNVLIQGGARLIRGTDEILKEYKNVSNIRINFEGYKKACPTEALCNYSVEKYEVAADERKTEWAVRTARKAVTVNENASSVKDAAEKPAEKAFDFSVIEDEGVRKSTKHSQRKKLKKTDADTVNEKDSASPKENTSTAEAIKVRSVTCEELAAECENFGVEMNDDIMKVCRVLSQNEKITVDMLHNNGCLTQASLQTLTILVQAGRLEETVGGVYIIRKNPS